jgi:hypothetical protein
MRVTDIPNIKLLRIKRRENGVFDADSLTPFIKQNCKRPKIYVLSNMV